MNLRHWNWKLSVCALALVLGAGCMQAQRPYRFTPAAQGHANVVDTLTSVLAAEGIEAKSVNHNARTVYTVWQDTGFMYGQVGQETATLVRRYVVAVSPQDEVTVRADIKRCAVGGFTIGDVEIRGRCEAVEGVTEGEQLKLDELGQKLELALGRPAVTGASQGQARPDAL